MTYARSSKRTKEGRHQAQTVWQQPAWKPVLTSCPPSSQRSLTDHWNCAKSLWPLTPSLNCYRLVDATELWASERPDTETVSSLRQSISWTLDIKRGTHIKHYYTLLIHHTFLFFISNFHMSDLTHNCLYYKLCFCFFVHCLFVYYSLVSVSCPVSVILLHCGASVRITNSLCVNIPGQ